MFVYAYLSGSLQIVKHTLELSPLQKKGARKGLATNLLSFQANTNIDTNILMIYRGTFLEVCDNTGAQQVLCLTQGPSTVGDIIKVSVRKAIPKARVKAGSLHYACITHVKTVSVRKDGHSLRTSANCVALLDAQGSPLGTRMTRPLPQDFRHGPFLKLRTLAPFVY